MGCHIQHNQIYHKYDQCRTKVFRYHQDQHVKSSYDRRHYEIFKFRRTLKTGCYKEHKYDLHQLRRLNIDSRNRKTKHRTIGYSSDNHNHRQRYNSDNSIKDSPF